MILYHSVLLTFLMLHDYFTENICTVVRIISEIVSKSISPVCLNIFANMYLLLVMELCRYIIYRNVLALLTDD